MVEEHSFGYWLRRKRKALDLTRAGLAEQVGCSAGTIQKLEEEERRPSAQMAERLADWGINELAAAAEKGEIDVVSLFDQVESASKPA